MKFAVVFTLCLAAVLAAPLGEEKNATIVTYENENIGVDGYKFNVETSNNIAFAEEGQLKNAGTDNEAIAVHGQYSYYDPDNVFHLLSYIADENGFRPIEQKPES